MRLRLEKVVLSLMLSRSERIPSRLCTSAFRRPIVAKRLSARIQPKYMSSKRMSHHGHLMRSEAMVTAIMTTATTPAWKAFCQKSSLLDCFTVSRHASLFLFHLLGIVFLLTTKTKKNYGHFLISKKSPVMLAGLF